MRPLLPLFFIAAITGSILPRIVRGSDSLSAIDEFDTLTVVGHDPNAGEPDSKTRAEPVAIIDAVSLRGRSSTLNDIVDRISGVRIRESGGLGSASRISVHGLEGKRIKIYVDGKEIGDLQGNAGIDDIPVDFIERIEVYKGYVPARFGSDGLGGAINVVLREFNTSSLYGSYSIGSFNTHKAPWLLKKKFDKLRLKLGTAGFFTHSDNNYVFTVPETKITIERDHDLYHAWAVAFTAELEDYFFDKIEPEGVYFRGYKEIQGIEKRILHAHSKSQIGAVGLLLEKQIGNLYLEIDPHFLAMEGNLVDTSNLFYVNWGDTTYSGNGEIGANDGASNSSAVRQDLTLRVMFEYVFNDDHSLNLSATGAGYRYENKDSLGNATSGMIVEGYPGELATAIAGLTWEGEFLNDRLLCLAGLKGLYYHSTVTDAFPALWGKPTTLVNKQPDWGIDFCVRINPVPPCFIKAGYQRNVRIPTAEELFGDGILITSSAELTPEQGNSLYTGILFDKWQVLFLTRIQYELNGFFMSIDDLIELKSYPPLGSKYYNLQSARNVGFDTELKVDFTEWLYGWGNMTLQNLRCTASKDSDGHVGKRLPYKPWFYCNFGAEIFLEKFFPKHADGKLFWNGSFTEEYYLDWVTTRKDRSVIIPSGFTMDAGIEYSLFDTRLSFCAQINNITDEPTFNLYKKPLPGRSFAFKIRASFIQ